MLGESFDYTKDGVIGKMDRWLKLVIATIILAIPLYGYVMRIYKGTKPAPEVDDWGRLFIDGILLLIVSFIYAIPVLILEFLMLGSAGYAVAMSGDPSAAMTGMMGAGILFIVFIIVAIIIGLLVPMAMVRFSRTGSFGEAFNFGAILGHIGKIGWVNYIVALIIGAIVVGIPVMILWFILIALMIAIPIIGLVIAAVVFLAVIPLITVFQTRYITQIYDTVAA